MTRGKLTVAGLPFRTAAAYAILFAIAACFYSETWPNAPVMVSDSPTYLSAAQDLSNFQVSQLRTPGYPLLLVLTGSNQSPSRTLFLVSLALHLVSIWSLGIALHHAGLTEFSLSLFAALLLLPPYVEPAAYVLSENLAEVALVASFISLVFWILRNKTTWIFTCALAAAFAAFTRPTYQFLVFGLVGYIIVVQVWSQWFNRGWREITSGSLILICSFLVLLGGYCYLNYRSFGYFGVTPKFGLTLSTKTWRFVERLPDEYDSVKGVLVRARNAQLIEDGGGHDGSMSIWAAVPELTRITGLEYKQLSNYMLKINLLLIQKAPLLYFREVVGSFGTYWFPSTTDLANFNSRIFQFLWAVLHFALIGAFAFNLFLLFGAATFIWKSRQFVKAPSNVLTTKAKLINLQAVLYGLAGTIVLYTVVVSCFVEVGDPRYRIPTDGLILFMLFLGTDLWQRLIDFSTIIPSEFQDDHA